MLQVLLQVSDLLHGSRADLLRIPLLSITDSSHLWLPTNLLGNVALTFELCGMVQLAELRQWNTVASSILGCLC